MAFSKITGKKLVEGEQNKQKVSKVENRLKW